MLSSAHKPQGGPVASARKTVIYMEMRQPRFFPLLGVFLGSISLEQRLSAAILAPSPAAANVRAS